MTKPITKKRKHKKAKWSCEEALHIAMERRETKKQGRKGKTYPTKCRVAENGKEK